MIDRLHQVFAIKAALEALRLNHDFGKQIGPARQVEAHRGGGSVERCQTCLGGLVGGRAVRVEMAIGMHRRQAFGHVGVVQVRNQKFAAGRVLVLSADPLMRAAVAQAKLPAGHVTALQGNDRQGLATRALSALSRQDQQLAVGHLGGAVVFFGHPGDEIEVGLVELVHARHPGVDRARRLPAIARGHVTDDLRQADVLPTAAARGLAAAAHVAGLAADHQGVWRAGDSHLIHGVAPHAG
ncbi:hypothetical protein D3C80_1375790 [compost metagenome]